jgi:hypothetical protein
MSLIRQARCDLCKNHLMVDDFQPEQNFISMKRSSISARHAGMR